MLRFVARRYDTFRPVTVEIERGRIVGLAPAAAGEGAELPLVAPGFVDLQINGYRGIEYNDPALSIEQVREVALSQDQANCQKSPPGFRGFTSKGRSFRRKTVPAEPIPSSTFGRPIGTSSPACRTLLKGRSSCSRSAPSTTRRST